MVGATYPLGGHPELPACRSHNAPVIAPAAISRVPGVTFLPFAAAQPTRLYVLGLRNMLVSTSFAHSPQGITKAGDPAAAAAAMGPYYPRAWRDAAGCQRR
jgi:hypothetical protein